MEIFLAYKFQKEIPFHFYCVKVEFKYKVEFDF